MALGLCRNGAAVTQVLVIGMDAGLQPGPKALAGLRTEANPSNAITPFDCVSSATNSPHERLGVGYCHGLYGFGQGARILAAPNRHQVQRPSKVFL